MTNYKLVPLKPTEEMLSATGLEPIRARAAYRAMVAEAPAVEHEPVSHDWDDQDKCRRCGDRDWYASATCTPKRQPAPDVTALVEALEQIERWDGFPCTGETWEGSGRPVSYAVAFGSIGERDFMRAVARKALAAYRNGERHER